MIASWEPEHFSLETSSVWSFPEHGKWATHNSKYRGNWSPYVPRNIILRYSQVGEFILDQFVGGGTTLVEAKLLNRNALGVDIDSSALQICKEKCSFQHENCGKVYLRQSDSRNLNFINDESIDLICTHPPYANAIKYSKDNNGDLSLMPLDDFLSGMKRVALECLRVLKNGKTCAFLIGDIRRNRKVIPLGFEVMKIFRDIGFSIKEIILKEQHNCSSTTFWMNKKERNFLLLAHEYLFVFEKN